LPLLGHELLGLDTRQVGFAFSLIAGVNFLLAPVGGVMADRMGRKQTVMLGLAIYGIGLGVIGFSVNFGWIAVGGVLIGVGTGIGEPSIFASITDMAPKGRRGTIYGSFLTLRDVGLLAGPVLAGFLADLVGLRFPIILNAAAMLGIALLFGFMGKEIETVKSAGKIPHSIK
jgi:MFS family permease